LEPNEVTAERSGMRNHIRSGARDGAAPRIPEWRNANADEGSETEHGAKAETGAGARNQQLRDVDEVGARNQARQERARGRDRGIKHGGGRRSG